MVKSPSSVGKLVILIALIVALAASWMGTLDKEAYKVNSASLKETTSAFVVIKSTDALITFAGDVPVIGSLLEPYNDFLDRMSWVLLISLMSLGVQKVIIVALQSYLISAVLSLSVLITIANGFKPFLSAVHTKKILKLSIVLIFVRFAIPVMTFAISALETSTYQIQTEVSEERVSALQDRLTDINKMLSADEKAKQEKELRLNQLKRQVDGLIDERAALVSEIKTLKNPGIGILEMAATMFKEVAPETEANISLRQDRITQIDIKISTLESELDASDSWFDFVTLQARIKIAIANLNELMTEMFDVFLTWAALFFFKNIFFPIVFLWGLLALGKGLFSSEQMLTLDRDFFKKRP